MRIEEEIKQSKFQSEYHKLVVNLQFTASWLGSMYSRIFRQHGISSQQFNVLRILNGQYPRPSSLMLVRERLLDKESNASRLIDKLVESGLTQRIQCPNDRRRVEITITDKGIAMLEQLNPKVQELNESLSHLDEDQARKLNELLDKLREN